MSYKINVTSSSDKNSSNQPLSPLTEEQLDYTMQFLQYAAEQDVKFANQFLTPNSVNDAMRRVSGSRIKPTQENIDRAYSDTSSNDELFVSYGDYFEFYEMMYARAIQYYGNMLSFDLELWCKNAKEEDYDNNQYQKDQERVKDFLNNFDYRNEFSKVTRDVIRENAVYTFLRRDPVLNEYTLQKMPRKYCKIDGKWSKGLLYSFDMLWFLDVQGVDIDMYPKSMRDRYKQLKENPKYDYDPSADVSKRNGQYVYWTQVTPYDGAWIFKFNEENISTLPILSPMFREMAYKPIAESLQNNMFLIKSHQIIMGLIGTHDDNRSGSRNNDLKLTPKMAADFSVIVRNQMNDGVNFAAVPFEDVKQFGNDLDKTNVLDEHRSTTSKAMGGASTVMYSSDKMNAIESGHAIDVDKIMIQSLYEGFANFIEFYANLETVKYKFKFRFVGSNLEKDKKTRLERADKDLQQGIINYQHQASARGYNYFEFVSMLEHSKKSGLDKYIRTFGTANTQSSKDSGGGGRSQKDESDMTESGVNTRQNAGNVEKGGDV